MKILLVDDHVLFREGLASLLHSQPDIEVIGSAESVRESIIQARTLMPDIILMDFSLPDGTGLDATRAILAKQPTARIIFLTMHEDDERLFAAIRAGAKGYLLKNVRVTKLLDFIRGVERGEAAITRAMTSRLFDKLAHSDTHPLPTSSALETLTNREIEVLQVIHSGASNREIAERLVISERTVKNHVSNILSKLNLKNRHEAANFARRHGLVDS